MPSKERQRQLAREKVQRQMAKRAEAARRRRRTQAMAGSALAVVAVVALAGLGIAKLHHPHKPASQTTKPKTGLCAYPRPQANQPGVGPRKVKAPGGTGIVRTGKIHVRLATNQGALTLTLDRGKAPCTVNSFLSLVRQKYFDKTPCHRITTTGIYILQCGDPTGTGTSGPGYKFADEGLPSNQSQPVTYPAGTVAMANAGPGTNGSQFFIVYRDTQFQPKYTNFGTVSSGLDLVLKVAKAGATAADGKPTGDGSPKKPVMIQQAQALG